MVFICAGLCLTTSAVLVFITCAVLVLTSCAVLIFIYMEHRCVSTVCRPVDNNVSFNLVFWLGTHFPRPWASSHYD